MPYTGQGTGYRPMDTSYEAAQAVEPDAGTWRAMAHRALTERGPMTADELAEHLGASPLTIRPRLSELRQAGRVRDTGDRRENRSGRRAAVWCAEHPPQV